MLALYRKGVVKLPPVQMQMATMDCSCIAIAMMKYLQTLIEHILD